MRFLRNFSDLAITIKNGLIKACSTNPHAENADAPIPVRVPAAVFGLNQISVVTVRNWRLY
jgi:hypothetical protein